jgi:hypothetical protein
LLVSSCKCRWVDLNCFSTLGGSATGIGVSCSMGHGCVEFLFPRETN